MKENKKHNSYAENSSTFLCTFGIQSEDHEKRFCEQRFSDFEKSVIFRHISEEVGSEQVRKMTDYTRGHEKNDVLLPGPHSMLLHSVVVFHLRKSLIS